MKVRTKQKDPKISTLVIVKNWQAWFLYSPSNFNMSNRLGMVKKITATISREMPYVYVEVKVGDIVDCTMKFNYSNFGSKFLKWWAKNDGMLIEFKYWQNDPHKILKKTAYEFAIEYAAMLEKRGLIDPKEIKFDGEYLDWKG